MRKEIENYQCLLGVKTTQRAIHFLKRVFEDSLAESLSLTRVSAPLFVTSSSGLNDGLNGVEKAISFKVNGIDDDLEIIHSLAKWKRYALGKYNFHTHTGLYTDMNAIRKDESLDFIHSCYVDQWDWEVVIERQDRCLDYLKQTVLKIYESLKKTERALSVQYPVLTPCLAENITFLTTTELEKCFPNLSRKEREDAVAREFGAVFLMQIGGPLSDGLPHDGRAADYDDWALNGDILLYYPLYDMALEVSSMGIRVDAESLKSQLKAKNEEGKLSNDYCKAVINDELPLTIGGGIGQSRLSMFFLRKAHIGEVQVSSWNKEEVERLAKKGIHLL